MKILILGGTNDVGIHLVNQLLKKKQKVTIATKGMHDDPFENQVTRIKIDRYDVNSMKDAFFDKKFDVVYDFLAYCSNDIKIALNSIHCKTYILVSSIAVYEDEGEIREDFFLPYRYRIKMGEASDFSYAEGKRQAEAVLSQIYDAQKSLTIRFPILLSEAKESNLLDYYVDHIVHEQPMYIDNMDAKLSFFPNQEAGRFLAFLASAKQEGVYHISSKGNMTVRQIIQYIEEKTNKKACICECDDAAPLNGMKSQTLYLGKVNRLTFKNKPLEKWMYDLLDHTIAQYM